MQAELEPPYLLIKPGIPEEEFYALGEDCGWEYVDGRLVMSPASDRHEDLFRFLITLFSAFLDVRGGEVVRGSPIPCAWTRNGRRSLTSSWSATSESTC